MQGLRGQAASVASLARGLVRMVVRAGLAVASVLVCHPLAVSLRVTQMVGVKPSRSSMATGQTVGISKRTRSTLQRPTDPSLAGSVVVMKATGHDQHGHFIGFVNQTVCVIDAP